ncbi:MAG: TolC family protein [Bacteroidales bacterium]
MKNIFKLSVLSVILASPLSIFAQDTLTVRETINRVISTYPTVKQAEEALHSTNINLKVTRSVLFPTLNASASYMYNDPQMKMTLGEQSFDLNPKNTYNTGVSLSQLLYDFGKTRPKIEAAKLQEEIAGYQVVNVKQDLALNTIQLYYTLYYTREAIKIKEQEKNNYEEMLRHVQVKKNVGTATKFDLLNTNVNLKNVQTQIINLATMDLTQQKSLSVLADTSITAAIPLVFDGALKPLLTSLDDLLNQAMKSRPEVLIAMRSVESAKLQEKAAARSYNPTLNLQAGAGWKNGYPMDLEKMKFNYNVGASLSIPIYEGGRRKFERNLAKSKIITEDANMNLILKQIETQVSQNYYSLQSSLASMDNLIIQVEFAEEAFNQAKVNFEAGTITNLELTTSATNLSSAKLLLLQSKINYIISLYRLKMSTGELIY